MYYGGFGIPQNRVTLGNPNAPVTLNLSGTDPFGLPLTFSVVQTNDGAMIIGPGQPARLDVVFSATMLELDGTPNKGRLGANAMLAVVAIHVAGGFVSSFLHRENLVRSMITGYKSGEPSEGITRPFAWLGVIMAVIIAAFLTLFQPSGNPQEHDHGTHSMSHEG